MRTPAERYLCIVCGHQLRVPEAPTIPVDEEEKADPFWKDPTRWLEPINGRHLKKGARAARSGSILVLFAGLFAYLGPAGPTVRSEVQGQIDKVIEPDLKVTPELAVSDETLDDSLSGMPRSDAVDGRTETIWAIRWTAPPAETNPEETDPAEPSTEDDDGESTTAPDCTSAPVPERSLHLNFGFEDDEGRVPKTVTVTGITVSLNGENAPKVAEGALEPQLVLHDTSRDDSCSLIPIDGSEAHELRPADLGEFVIEVVDVKDADDDILPYTGIAEIEFTRDR